MKASDLIVRCLENEAVKYVFGVPGEENIDVMDALLDSSIRFIATRHEQGAAFMADVYGRLTGRAGVCLSTLGPGATNLMTGVADANLDHAPVVAITGQAGLRPHAQGDRTSTWTSVESSARSRSGTRTIERPVDHPGGRPQGLQGGEAEKPGASHIDFPEDVAEEEVEGVPLSDQRPRRPSPGRQALQSAARLIESLVVSAHPRGQRRDPRRRLPGAARLRPGPRHSGGQHVHGQGVHAVRRSARPAHRRAAGP